MLTGTGRCGTGYAFKVLESAGVRCGHESVFNREGWDRAAHKMRYGYWEADSSWLAAPWLPRLREEFPGVLVVHLVRHPRDVVASWLSNRIFGGLNGDWLRWALGHLSPIPEDELEAVAWYFCEWTKLVEPHADRRVRVEDGAVAICHAAGVRLGEARALYANARYNHRNAITRRPEVAELPEPWRSDIMRWCEEWGYDD